MAKEKKNKTSTTKKIKVSKEKQKAVAFIDFKEIPKANSGNGDQDTFELFARDFLELLGYEIVLDPARGADNGKDLIVKEIFENEESRRELLWLVSCKHYAFSGAGINLDIEGSIVEKVVGNNCKGFIGFYSTIATSGLVNILQGSSHYFRYKILDWRKIEKHIVGNPKFDTLFLRYFPESYRKYRDLYFASEPVKLFQSSVENGEHKDVFEVLLKLYKDVGYLIKAIRRCDTIIAALQEIEVQMIVEPSLFDLFHGVNFTYCKEDARWTFEPYDSSKVSSEYKFEVQRLFLGRGVWARKEMWNIFSHPYYRFLHGVPSPRGNTVRKDPSKPYGQLIFIPGTDHVTTEMKFKYNIDLAEQPDIKIIDFQQGGAIYTYANHIIVNNEYLSKLESAFHSFKGMLTH